jgi:hypothetical protein
MAVSTAAISRVGRNIVGRRFEEARQVTFDSSYPTGGEVLAASAFNLSFIRCSVGNPQIISGFAAGFAHCDALVQTDGSLLLRLRAAAGTEVPNATDASTVVVNVTVQGY